MARADTAQRNISGSGDGEALQQYEEAKPKAAAAKAGAPGPLQQEVSAGDEVQAIQKEDSWHANGLEEEVLSSSPFAQQQQQQQQEGATQPPGLVNEAQHRQGDAQNYAEQQQQQQQQKREPLADLLRKALPPGPAGALCEGAVLALALHCIFVEEGLRAVDESGRVPANRYQPPRGWHGTFQDEWVFQYGHPAKQHRFVLHCSLQRASGRMFVSARELHQLNNQQVLGLQVQNYVPDRAALHSRDWDGVVARQDVLASLAHEHLVVPLLDGAVDALPGMDAAGLGPLLHQEPWYYRCLPSTRTTYTVVLPAVAVAAVAVAAAGVYVAMGPQRRANVMQRMRWSRR